ncbi:MAG: hypothetical protein Q7S31_02060 [bacterium]|nr:hypothetical protein [bacterium]
MTSVMLFGALRGARRAAAVAAVRNEGSYALNTMSQMLRFAQGTPDCTESNAVTFTSANDQQATKFACTAESIASNSAKLTSSKVVTKDCTISCSPAGNEVYIQFTLSPAGATDSVIDAASVTFDSQVELRNVR